MRMIEIPQFPILHGQDAIEALNEIIEELEEQKNKELTRKQAKAIIKFAKGLICSIEAEMLSQVAEKNKPRRFGLFKKIEVSKLPFFK